MFDHQYLQNRLNSMILSPEEIEAFKQRREQHAKTNLTLVAQEKFEAARKASIDMLKSMFVGEEAFEMPKIEERVLVHHFGFAAKR